jgi:membrane protease YdiL (CAAX protease family)
MPPEIPELPPELPRTEPITSGLPWGFWATIGWSVLIFIGSIFAQFVGGFIGGLIAAARGEKLDASSIASDGNILALGTCLSGIAALALVILFAWVRKGIDLKTYLALQLPTKREFSRWFICLLLLVLATDALSALLGRPIVPEVIIEIYQDTGWARPFLLLAILVGAPLSEEFLFRGFLFAGFQRSWLGTIGTIIVTSVLWAAIHVQYDHYGMAVIFLAGLVLGFARAKTGSLWLCVMLHSLMNVIAMIELLTYLSVVGK